MTVSSGPSHASATGLPAGVVTTASCRSPSGWAMVKAPPVTGTSSKPLLTRAAVQPAPSATVPWSGCRTTSGPDVSETVSVSGASAPGPHALEPSHKMASR